MDYNTGIEEAKEEGYNKRKRRTEQSNGSKIQKLEIAKKLKNKGMSNKEISEITGIEEKELEKLKI